MWDSRACGSQGTDDAQVMVSCKSLKEARSYNGDYGQVAIYKYRINEKGELVDEEWVEDFYG